MGLSGARRVCTQFRFVNACSALVLAVCAWAALSATPAAAQSELQTKLVDLQQQLAAQAVTDESSAEELSAALTSTAEQIATLEEERDKLTALEARISDAPEKIASYRVSAQDIQSAPATVASRMGEQPDMSDLEAEIKLVEAQRRSWTKERSDNLEQLSAAAQPDSDLSERMEVLTGDLASPTVAGPGDNLSDQIDALRNRAIRSAQSTELERLRLEFRSASTLNSVRSARVAWLDAAIADSDSYLEDLRRTASDLRESAVQQRRAAVRRALGELGEVPPALTDFTDDTLALLQRLQSLSRRAKAERSRLSETRDLAERIEQDATLTRRRLEVAGLESKFGEVMLSRLASLPDSRNILARTTAQSDRIAIVSIDAIDSEQAIRALPDRTFYLDHLESSADSQPVTERERQALSLLYDQHRDMLVEVLDAQNSLLRLLVDNNQATEALAVAAANYEEMLTAQLLWVRSYAFLNVDDFRAKLQRILGMRPFSAIATNSSRLSRHPETFILAGLLLVLVARRKRIKAFLEARLGKPIRPRDESASLLIRTTIASVLLVLRIPLLLIVLGRVIAVCADGDSNLIALHLALHYTGLAWFFWRLFEVFSGRLGVGRRLLKWNSQRIEALMRDMSWSRPIVLSAVFVCVFANSVSPTDSGGLLGAAGSLIIALTLIVILARLLSNPGFEPDWLGRIFTRIVVIAAVAIAVMHLSGQLFAAHLYLKALGNSILAVILVLCASSVLKRLVINYRARVGREHKDELRELTADEVADDGVASESEDALNAVNSLSQAYEQLLKLLRLVAIAISLWWIWSPALPALNVFDTVTLWTTADAGIDGQLRAVTLTTLMLVILIVSATLLTTRHLPPLLNVALIEWTGVSPGARYASGMLMQYLIIGIGFSIAMMLLGFRWEKVQWLVAALGVGIGFGLQEIVANFISGLIVLFERPIRVGDIINAGGADGIVRRINPRATVIETFDGKEVMVPNKELITNVVTNWSLSSSKLRVVVSVGIAYGSDLERAARLLHGVGVAHPEILEEPYPMVTFEDFGDNALTLWLRCHTLKDYPRIASELRHRIYEVFNREGISISFPQRDVHLDVKGSIPIELVEPQRGQPTAEPES